ncbi:MAG: FKBP-type peptidyl-prolyl cis-trans isomerase [Prevotella sp.]|nr:FKBP-type peptidyl-prolyl cis-trans isomerase [Prevotella sp.]
MKKLTIMAATAIAASALFSCGGNTPKPSLKNDIDTVSYAIGMAQTQGLMPYLANAKGVDTTMIAEFIQGLTDAVNAGEDKKKAAYFAGIEIGQQIAGQAFKGINGMLFGDDSTQTISTNNFMAGFISAITGKDQRMTIKEADSTAQAMIETIKARTMEKKYGEAKKKNEDFLAENKGKEGVVTLPSGVQYKILKEGKGAIPADTSNVEVNYEGKLIDGTVFDSSLERGKPATFAVNQVIAGWQEVLKMMPVGSEWEIYIPQDKAYGSRETGNIPPFSTLIFKVELLGIK